MAYSCRSPEVSPEVRSATAHVGPKQSQVLWRYIQTFPCPGVPYPTMGGTSVRDVMRRTTPFTRQPNLSLLRGIECFGCHAFDTTIYKKHEASSRTPPAIGRDNLTPVLSHSVRVASPTSPAIGTEDLYACVTSRTPLLPHPTHTNISMFICSVKVASLTPPAIGKEDLHAVCIQCQNSIPDTTSNWQRASLRPCYLTEHLCWDVPPIQTFPVCVECQSSIPATTTNWQRGSLRLRYLTGNLCWHIPPIQPFPGLYLVSE